MNQEKIGKFITKCRQEKNLTQEENIYKYTKELKKRSITISLHEKETTINLHTNNAYGDDGINLKYKELLNNKTISIEKIDNKIYYSAEYNIN